MADEEIAVARSPGIAQLGEAQASHGSLHHRHGGTAEDISKPIPVVSTPMQFGARSLRPAALEEIASKRVIVWFEWLRMDALGGAAIRNRLQHGGVLRRHWCNVRRTSQRGGHHWTCLRLIGIQSIPRCSSSSVQRPSTWVAPFI